MHGRDHIVAIRGISRQNLAHSSVQTAQSSPIPASRMPHRLLLIYHFIYVESEQGQKGSSGMQASAQLEQGLFKKKIRGECSGDRKNEILRKRVYPSAGLPVEKQLLP